MSAAKSARNRRLVAAHLREPGLSWAELGARFKVSRVRARQIVAAEVGAVRRPPRPLTLHACRAAGCEIRFAHRRGYDGPYCPAHRGAARRIVLPERPCAKPGGCPNLVRPPRRYCSTACRDAASAERLRSRR